MPAQFVRLTTESTYNAYNSAGATLDLFLPSGNAQTIRPDAKFWEIADAGVGNRLVRRNVGWTSVGGTISTLLFPSQAPALLALAATFVSSPPCYDIASFTVDHAIFLDFGCTAIYRRYTGCKISNLALSADMSDGGYPWVAKIDVIGSTPRTITSSDFATPTLGSYPADDPYLFGEAAGNVVVGAARTNFQSLSVVVANTIGAFRDENPYASSVSWFSRRIGFGGKFRFKSNADRLLYEAGTKQAASLELNNGTHTVTFGFGGQTIIDSIADDLPMNDFDTYTLSMTSMMDGTLSPPTDLTITTT